MITDFASLKLALNDWIERGYADAKLEEAIGLAEAAIRRSITGYQREEDYSFTTDPDGYATLPKGFLGVRFINNAAGQPQKWTISGKNIYVADGASATFPATIFASLLSLSASNPTNWLIDIAPDAYLWMAQSQLYAYEQEWATASGMSQQALAIIADLNLQSTVAQYNRTGMTLPVQAV